MRAALCVALLLSVVASGALAKGKEVPPVVCGKDWVTVVPYKYGTIDLHHMAFLVRHSDILFGQHWFRLDMGFLRVKKGRGLGPTLEELKLPGLAYLHVAGCLLHGPAGPAG